MWMKIVLVCTELLSDTLLTCFLPIEFLLALNFFGSELVFVAQLFCLPLGGLKAHLRLRESTEGTDDRRWLSNEIMPGTASSEDKVWSGQI